MAPPTTPPGARPAVDPAADMSVGNNLETMYNELIVQRERWSRISEKVSEIGAALALKGVQESNAELLRQRQRIQGDFEAYKTYLQELSSETTSILNQTEAQFKQNFEQKQAITRALQETFVKATEQMSRSLESVLKVGGVDRTEEFKTNLKSINDVVVQINENFSGVKTGANFEKLQNDIQARVSSAKELFKIETDTLSVADAKKLRIYEELKNKKELTDGEKEIFESVKRNKVVKKQMALDQIDVLAKQKLQQEIEKAILDLKQEELRISLPLVRYEKERVENSKQLEGAMDGVLNKLTRSSSQSTLLSRSLFSIFADKDGLGSGIKSFMTDISKGLTAAFLDPQQAIARVVSYIDKNLVQSTFEFNKIMADVNKNTGGFGQGFEKIAMTSGIFQGSAVTGLAAYGVSLKDFGAAYTSLAREVGNFNNLSDAQRKILSENAAQLTNLGISADSYAKVTKQLMGSLQTGVEGAKNAINDLAKDAITLGKDIGKYVSEFDALFSKVIGFGKEASQIFKELSAFAQATNNQLSAADFSNFSTMFDTFDNGAQSIAKLNMVLGGTSANLLDIMKMDPSERILAIKSSFDATGQSFDNLNIGYKRVLAELFGGDVAKAAAFFKMDLAEAQDLIDKQVASEKELEERKKKSVDAQQKLTIAIENMRIAFTPLIDLVSGFADLLIGIQSIPVGGPVLAFFIGLAPLIIGAKMAFRAFTAAATQSAGLVATSVAAIRTELVALQMTMMELQSLGPGATISPARLTEIRTEAASVVAPTMPPGPTTAPGMSKMMKGTLIAAGAIALVGLGAKMYSESKKKEEAEEKEALKEGVEDAVVDRKSGKYLKIDRQDQVENLTNNFYQVSKPGGAISAYSTNLMNTNASTLSFLQNSISSLKQNAVEAYSNVENFSSQMVQAGKDLFSYSVEKEKITMDKSATSMKETFSQVMTETGGKYPDKLQVSLNIPRIEMGKAYKEDFMEQIADSGRFKGPSSGVI